MAKCGERLSDRVGAQPEQAVSRYLGLSLGGAKSDRTSLTVVDYYRKQEKAFVVDIYESIGPEGELDADQVLISLIDEVSNEVASGHHLGVQLMGVDAPLTLPPCLISCDAECAGYDKCKKPEVRWMRQQYVRAKAKNKRLKHPTPYSQRPVDLYFRYRNESENVFQDETMGANLAPQTVRMSYLKRYLADVALAEVWPKLALFNVHKGLKLSRREVLEYRHLERGAHIRSKILERLAEKCNLFVYERDFKKLVTNVGAFESLICAWVAMQANLDRVVKFKSDLPLETGWVQIPEL